MSRRRRRQGFTLIEVLLVLVILVILGSFAVFQVGAAQRKALNNAAKSQIGTFQTPLDMYQLDVGQYPSTSAGLDALLYPPSELQNPNKWGPEAYINKIPQDPWQRPYQYSYPGKMNTESYDIWSFGPDGQDGTEDDIGNWDDQY
ncbi:MAG: type II secretion system major pseudopilin GspG [Pirellulales bacterium]